MRVLRGETDGVICCLSAPVSIERSSRCKTAAAGALPSGTFPRQPGQTLPVRGEKYTVSAVSMGNLFGLVSVLDNEWQGVGSGVDRAEPCEEPRSGGETDSTVIPGDSMHDRRRSAV